MQAIRVLIVAGLLLASCSVDSDAARPEDRPQGSTTASVFDSSPPAGLDAATEDLVAAFEHSAALDPNDHSSMVEAIAEFNVRNHATIAAHTRFTELLGLWEYAPIGARQFADATGDLVDLNDEMVAAFDACWVANESVIICSETLRLNFDARLSEAEKRVTETAAHLPATGSWSDTYP